jgi:hypothetical protein
MTNIAALDDPATTEPLDDTPRDYVLPTRDGPATVRGRLIGFASSHRDDHNHPGHEFAPITNIETNRRAHCTACRWFEVRIIQEYDDNYDPSRVDVPHVDSLCVGYVVHTLGGSVVPDDTIFCRLARTESPYEVVELLTVRRDGQVMLPGHSARVLAQASHYDEYLADAYVNRAAA